MASITITTPDTYECSFDDCSRQFTDRTAVQGSYCSRECAHRAAARSLLRDIRQDHRFCWACFRQRKEIERPSDEFLRGRGRHAAEAIVGFEYLTGTTEKGPHGIECECGALDHDVDWGQRAAGPYEWYLYRCSLQLRDEGKRDDALDLPTLVDALWETDDLELAVARALGA